MPCDSGPGPSYAQELKNTEKELCKARWLLLQLRKKLNGQKLPNSLARYVKEQRAAQLKHRLEDKESAVQKIKDKLNEVHQDVKEIQKLGGTPTIVLFSKRDNLNRKLREVKQVSNAQLLERSWCNPTTVVDSILSWK